MKIESQVQDQTLNMKVSGRLDTTTAPNLEVALMGKDSWNERNYFGFPRLRLYF